MTNIEMVAIIEKRNDLVRQIEELKAKVDIFENDIKDEMLSRKIDELLCEGYKVSYKEVTAQKFDSKIFKQKEGNELYEKYCFPSTYRRFQIR